MNTKLPISLIRQLVIAMGIICMLVTSSFAAADLLDDLQERVTALEKQADMMVRVPVGTIMAYGGDLSVQSVRKNLEAAGWLPCDGVEYSNSKYGDLYAAIGTNFGGDKDKFTFNVPDLRGRFLRGVDQATKRDPDSKDRKPEPAGANAGDKVGSVQEDAFQAHNHNLSAHKGVNKGGGGEGYDILFWGDDIKVGSAETRPKNVYVYWIIKYREDRE